MDSSSDGSFAWTDASDDSTDNETMAKPKRNLSQSGDESESGKTYKKNLQQRLLSTHEHENDVEKPDRKKRRHSPQLSDPAEVESPKRKRIKTEPESDVDAKRSKKKHKTSDKGQDSDNDPYDEGHLNIKVKNEENFVAPSPVKKKKLKKKVLDASDTSMVNGSAIIPDAYGSSTSHDTETKVGDEYKHTDINENGIHKTKKKKKKSKARKEDSYCEKAVDDRNTVDSSAEEGTCNTAAGSQPDMLSDEPHIDISSILSEPSLYDDTSNVEETVTDSKKSTNSPRDTGKTYCRKSTISERIMFEDEDDSDVQTKSTMIAPIKKVNKKKTKLKSFIDSSLRLRPFSVRLPTASVLSGDDDVWLVKCPKDVKVEDFQGKKWALDNKCKIKLGGHTYEGDLDDNPRNVTILSNNKDRVVIKNLEVHGCVRLHRRIPKAHIRDENIIVNNQTNFIPLPETKCRHPFFGVHYKKAIKLPSAVAERLRTSHTETETSTPTGKRKKKRDRRKMDAVEEASPKQELSAPQDDFTPAVDTSIKKKKKKKRKHSDTADEGLPQQKRIRHDPESAEAWESEKAIEENLFNF